MGTYSIFGQGARGGNPVVVSAGGPNVMSLEVGISSDVYATHIWFMRLNSASAPTVGRLYSVATATTGTAVPGTDVTFSYGTELGWLNAPFAAPVFLPGGSLYRICILQPAAFTYTNTYWTTGLGSAGLSNGPIAAANSANVTGGKQGQFVAGSTMRYTTGGGGTNYWIDMTVTDTINERPLPIQNIQQAVDRSNNY